LGVNIEKTFIPHPVAMQQLRKGEAGWPRWCSSPLSREDLSSAGQWEPGFKFLPLPYDANSRTTTSRDARASEYPNLIKAGERISTIAVPSVLVAYNWPGIPTATSASRASPDLLFSRIEKFAGTRLRPEMENRSISAPRFRA
jgi:hypothetical protein